MGFLSGLLLVYKELDLDTAIPIIKPILCYPLPHEWTSYTSFILFESHHATGC
jgi:hypothetical protein